MRILVDWKRLGVGAAIATWYAIASAGMTSKHDPAHTLTIFLVCLSVFLWPIVRDLVAAMAMAYAQRRPERSRMIERSSRHSGLTLPHLPPA
jgi:hypothetical protein